MDQERDELLKSNVKGKNPFQDVRVRQAFYQAIDIEAIERTVMRGQSRPTALMVGPGVNGYIKDARRRPALDAEGARSCWPRPATRTASTSAWTARTTAT